MVVAAGAAAAVADSRPPLSCVRLHRLLSCCQWLLFYSPMAAAVLLKSYEVRSFFYRKEDENWSACTEFCSAAALGVLCHYCCDCRSNALNQSVNLRGFLISAPKQRFQVLPIQSLF